MAAFPACTYSRSASAEIGVLRRRYASSGRLRMWPFLNRPAIRSCCAPSRRVIRLRCGRFSSGTGRPRWLWHNGSYAIRCWPRMCCRSRFSLSGNDPGRTRPAAAPCARFCSRSCTIARSTGSAGNPRSSGGPRTLSVRTNLDRHPGDRCALDIDETRPTIQRQHRGAAAGPEFGGGLVRQIAQPRPVGPFDRSRPRRVEGVRTGRILPARRAEARRPRIN